MIFSLSLPFFLTISLSLLFFSFLLLFRPGTDKNCPAKKRKRDEDFFVSFLFLLKEYSGQREQQLFFFYYFSWRWPYLFFFCIQNWVVSTSSYENRIWLGGGGSYIFVCSVVNVTADRHGTDGQSLCWRLRYLLCSSPDPPSCMCVCISLGTHSIQFPILFAPGVVVVDWSSPFCDLGSLSAPLRLAGLSFIHPIVYNELD